jgi:oligopeptide/dipeptide ABC transporter ATP-binding protein
MSVSPPLLEVAGLTKHFGMSAGWFGSGQPPLRAVDGLAFTVRRGRTLALVGESGCGKSTTGRLLLRLIEATAGSVRFDGVEVLSAAGAELQALRRRMQIIFQDPYSSLDPRMTIGQILAEPLAIHAIGGRAERRDMVRAMLSAVGLAPEYADRYPHSFSGGQRQRIGIARALVLAPEFVVCDEPVSALDVSIQAQIVNLLKNLQRERGLAYLFISHDLSVVKHISDEVAVMYLGRIVEIAEKGRLYTAPQHPYTRALLSAIPVPDPRSQRRRMVLAGELPDARRPPSGCRFRLQCPFAQPICAEADPPLAPIASDHAVACHFAGRLSSIEAFPTTQTAAAGAVEPAPRSFPSSPRMEIHL